MNHDDNKHAPPPRGIRAPDGRVFVVACLLAAWVAPSLSRADVAPLTPADFEITPRQVTVSYATDLRTGELQIVAPATIEVMVTPPERVGNLSIVSDVKSVFDDTGREVPISEENRQRMNANPMRRFFPGAIGNLPEARRAASHSLRLPTAPRPPRTIGEVRGTMTIRAAMPPRTFDIPLDAVGREVKVNDQCTIKLRALAREGKQLAVGLEFTGMSGSTSDQSSPLYVVRVALLDGEGREVTRAMRGRVEPAAGQAVYRFDWPDEKARASLRVEMVTEVATVTLPLSLKFKPPQPERTE